MEESVRRHRDEARETAPIRVAVVTVSDTRTENTDASGRCLRELLTGEGHEVARSEILPDDPERIRALVVTLADGGGIDVVLLTGGTGVSPRDHTFEAVSGAFDRPLPGFGELFRMLSFAEIGAAAMLSRAVAGIRGRTAVFALPGSPAAVRLAMTKLILPELRHLVHQMRG